MVATHVGVEYRYACSARQAMYIVWLEQKSLGSRVSWREACDGWETKAVDAERPTLKEIN